MLSIFNRQQNAQLKRRSHAHQFTLNRFFDEQYFPHVQVTKSDTKHDWSIFNSHIRMSLGEYRLHELSNSHLDIWVREQLLAQYQRSTINKHIFLMNRIFTLARHWGYLEHRQTLTNIQRLTLGDYKQRFLSKDEIERLLVYTRRSTHPHIHNFIRLLLLTGARNSEARFARWCDIDRAQQIWLVPRSKNGRSRRIILSTSAMSVIDECYSNAQRLGLYCNSGAYLFTNPRTQKPYHSFYLAWDKIRRAADLDDLRIHDLRHTYASLLINKGVTLYEVQTLLGHSSMQMTQRYAHLQPNQLHNKAEIVGNIVSGAGDGIPHKTSYPAQD